MYNTESANQLLNKIDLYQENLNFIRIEKNRFDKIVIETIKILETFSPLFHDNYDLVVLSIHNMCKIYPCRNVKDLIDTSDVSKIISLFFSDEKILDRFITIDKIDDIVTYTEKCILELNNLPKNEENILKLIFENEDSIVEFLSGLHIDILNVAHILKEYLKYVNNFTRTSGIEPL